MHDDFNVAQCLAAFIAFHLTARTQCIVHEANQPRGEDQTTDFAKRERIRTRTARARLFARGVQLSELVETDIDCRADWKDESPKLSGSTERLSDHYST